MKYMNIIEKIICLFNIVKNSWIDLIFLGILLLLLILLSMKKISKKKTFVLSFTSYILLLGYTIINHYETLAKTLDSIMNHLFKEIYFPSAYAYLFTLILMNLVIIGSFFNIKKKNNYKTINSIFFLGINFILTLVLEIVAKNKIDIFSKKSLFSNTNLVILLEISINIFILWLLTLAISYLTNIITERIILSKEQKEEINQPLSISSEVLSVNVSNLAEDYEKDSKKELTPSITENLTTKIETMEPSTEYQFIPKVNQEPNLQEAPRWNKQIMIEELLANKENSNKNATLTINASELEMKNTDSLYDIYKVNDQVNSLNSVNNYQNFLGSTNSEKETNFDLSSFIPKTTPKTIMNSSNNNHILEQILKNELPLTEPISTLSQNVQKEVPTEKDTYTLNDYRIFNKMLKDIKEHNQSNTISIDKNLEYRLITKYSSETYNMFKRMLKNYSN